MKKMTYKMNYEKWGNNEYHDPEVCKNCESNTCKTCSNGPRQGAYRRALAESRMSYNMW